MAKAQDWLNGLGLDKDTATEIHLGKVTATAAGSAYPTLTVDCEDLTGEIRIEGYKDLEAINLERYKSGLAGVKTRGHITKVIIKDCPNLKSIDLDENEISEIVFEGQINNLIKLDVNDNKLTGLDISKFINLEELDISKNASINLTNLKGLENLSGLKKANFLGTNGGQGLDFAPLKALKDGFRLLLGITGELPDNWPTQLASRLGGKNLKNMWDETGLTLAGLIANFSADKNSLQQQLNQAQAELDSKKDYDTIKSERDNLKQQLDAIKNQLGIGSNATQQQIIDKIKELQRRPTTSCNHADYDAIKAERDGLKAKVESKERKITELEKKGKESIKVLTDATNTWGMKFSNEQKQTIQNASTAQEVNEVVKTEVSRLKDENSSSHKLNIGLGVLTIGSLLVIVWMLMKQTSLPEVEPNKKKKQ